MQSLKLIECKNSVLKAKVLVLSPSEILGRQAEANQKERKEQQLKRMIISLCIVLGLIFCVICILVFEFGIGYTDSFGEFFSAVIAFGSGGVLSGIGYWIYHFYEKHL